ncbi:MAG: dynamin family protein [Pseudomonadota bacterium]
MKIAPKMRHELDFLRENLVAAEKVVDRRKRQAFRDLRERLDNWAAKVAVIGQVKAGKSTFMNAFLHQDDLLPSDVNPWTSVVTNIRINMPNDPAFGAKFEFFDEPDWQEILDGGSKIRKLTEQLLPGFDTDLLRRQSEEMKARAQRRLGDHYESLLGTEHDYDFLTPDLLKHYVCAGPATGDDDADQSGRYASLTKVANAYMRLPEFQVPTILTDTPGVNDPFLVRDEFTCRSLDKSDVFIVALSAHQPLTEVDIALIRILAKQDSKDVLIFVNRIDELDDLNAELPRVMEDVARRLKKAIPDIDFAMVAGSAFMAQVAMRDDEEAQEARVALDTPELADYLRAQYGAVPDDQVDRLLMGSGIADVKETLSRVIDNGVGTGQLAQLLGDIRAELNAAQFIARREREAIQAQVESVQSDVAEAAAEELEHDLAKVAEAHDALEHHVSAADDQLEKAISKSWSSLETKLVNHVTAFVDSQQRPLSEYLISDEIRGGKRKGLDIDLAPLQIAIEKEVLKNYEKSRASTDVVLNNCIHVCRQVVKDSYDDPTENITLDDLPYSEFASTLMLAKKSLRLELIAERSWQFWRRQAVDVDKSLTALRTIAAAELRPPIEKILAAFNEAQVERATAGMSRVNVMLRMIEVMLDETKHRLKTEKTEFERLARDPEMREGLVRQLQSKMEVLEQRLINLSAVDGVLSKSELSEAA